MSWHEYNIYSKTYTEGSDPFAKERSVSDENKGRRTLA
jgi:hypothetical protein